MKPDSALGWASASSAEGQGFSSCLQYTQVIEIDNDNCLEIWAKLGTHWLNVW